MSSNSPRKKSRTITTFKHCGIVSPSCKKRVDSATTLAGLGSGRCAVERCSREQAIEYCRMVARRHGSKQDAFRQQLDIIEFRWGLRQKSLNLDSRYNIIPLGPVLHTLFEQHSWLLLPELHILEFFHSRLTQMSPIRRGKMRNAILKREVGLPAYKPKGKDSSRPGDIDGEDIVANDFVYRFIRTRIDIERLYITVDTAADTRLPDARPNESDFQVYTYPFADLFIRSHVRPHFVILELGRRFARPQGRVHYDLVYAQHDGRAYELIREIYSAWTTRISEEEEEEHPEFFEELTRTGTIGRDRDSSVMTRDGRE